MGFSRAMEGKIYFKCSNPFGEHLEKISDTENVKNDFSLSHMISLKKELQSIGYKITGARHDSNIILELHENAFDKPDCAGVPLVGYAVETEHFWPNNYDRSILSRYKAFFHFDEEFLARNEWAIKTTEPRHLSSQYFDYEIMDWAERDFFIVCINRNKNYKTKCNYNGYEERVKFMRSYLRDDKCQAIGSLALYGAGWDYPPKPAGFIDHYIFRTLQVFQLRWISKLIYGRPIPAPVWRGPISTKSLVLSRSRFGLAIENVYYRKGYVTEKIFDCIRSGCVPITKGDPITSFKIPKSLYINIDDFDSYDDLFAYMREYDSHTYTEWLNARLHFIETADFRAGTAEYFAKNIVRKIASLLQ